MSEEWAAAATPPLELVLTASQTGIAAAAPVYYREIQGAQAADGSHFALHDKPDDAWLAWRPVVRLGPADVAPPLPRIDVAATSFAVEDLMPAEFAVQTASHVRAGPGTTYKVIDTLAQGATVEVTGEVPGRRVL